MLSFLPFKASSRCPGRSKPGWLCIPSSILPGPGGSLRGRVAPRVPKWLSFVSQQLPGRCSRLSLKVLAAVESFICSGARIIGVLQVQNSLGQLHRVHLKATLQVLADSPQQLASVYTRYLTAVFRKGRRDSCNVYSCLHCLGKKQHAICPGLTENALSQC